MISSISGKDGLIVSVVGHCVGVVQEQLRRRSHAELSEDRVSEVVRVLLALSKECRAELRVAVGRIEDAAGALPTARRVRSW
jgi:flagellar motor protein MotB